MRCGVARTVQSYDGKLDFGFIADPELVPHVWLLTELMHESMDELLSLR
jgi:diacylglycerol O-acyltransferase / wax synthase